MELISVIIPAYNAEKYLKRCLDSVLHQTYPAIEIIVVNDGSTDGTGALLDAMAKEDARIVPIHQENAGVAEARLAGIRRATGAYLSFVDADDFLDSRMIEYLLNLIHTHRCPIACCRYYRVTDSTMPPQADTQGAVREYTLDKVMRNLYRDKLWSLWGKLYRRELFNEKRLMVEPLSLGEDLLLVGSLYCQCERIAVSEAQLYYYFRHNDAVMVRPLTPAQIRDSMRAYRLVAQALEKDSKAYEYHMQNLLSNDFGFLNKIILTNVCRECYNELRAEILQHRRYAFINKDNPTLNGRHRLGIHLLRFCPPLFNIMIKIKG